MAYHSLHRPRPRVAPPVPCVVCTGILYTARALAPDSRGIVCGTIPLAAPDCLDAHARADCAPYTLLYALGSTLYDTHLVGRVAGGAGVGRVVRAVAGLALQTVLIARRNES